MALMKVYKDRQQNTWYWQCNVVFCVNSDWAVGGHPDALREGLHHLRQHRRVGFGRR